MRNLFTAFLLRAGECCVFLLYLDRYFKNIRNENTNHRRR